ncbi:unnamed protein product [Allacma fusca]|uniref:Uncharacterized protein n=1 Tax=Allacma fusca TaxID=39272 RepID=A0A8J2L1J8_9HEXA|nr:unnamed protein product [Allacma fusca]
MVNYGRGYGIVTGDVFSGDCMILRTNCAIETRNTGSLRCICGVWREREAVERRLRERNGVFKRSQEV